MTRLPNPQVENRALKERVRELEAEVEGVYGELDDVRGELDDVAGGDDEVAWSLLEQGLTIVEAKVDERRVWGEEVSKYLSG